eukprot:contig_2981_g631
MLKLSVVTTAEYEKSAAGDNDADLPHGTTVLKRLVAPWAGTQRIICADSYFASVATAQQLLTMGLRFVGVVKTATRGYPMGALSAIPLQSRGQHVSFSHVNADNVTDLMAVLWVDRERRQDDLQLERKYITHDWSMRVNLTLLAICIVDAWMLYTGARVAAGELTQAEFYEDLAAQLIENTFDGSGYRSRAAPADVPREDVAGPARYGVGVHLVPTLKRKGGDARLAQRDCRVCKQNRSTSVCS